MISRSLSSFPTLPLTAFPLSGGGPMSAQNPAGQYMPVNAVSDGNDARVIFTRGVKNSPRQLPRPLRA